MGIAEGYIGSLGLADANYLTQNSKHKVLLYGTGNSIQYPVINHHGKECEKEYMHIYISIFIYIYIVHNGITLLYSR